MAIAAGNKLLQSDIQYLYNSFNNVNNYRNFGALTAPGAGTTVLDTHMNTLVTRLNAFRGDSTILNGAPNGGLGSWPTVSAVSRGAIIYADVGVRLNTAAGIAARMRCYKAAQNNGALSNGNQTNGRHSNGTHSNGRHSNGRHSNGTHSNGRHSNGRHSNGTNGNGTNGNGCGESTEYAGCHFYFNGGYYVLHYITSGSTYSNGDNGNGGQSNGNQSNGAQGNGALSNGTLSQTAQGNGALSQGNLTQGRHSQGTHSNGRYTDIANARN